MARSDGSIIIDTRVDADGFGKGVKSMKSQIGGLTNAVGKLGAAIGLAFGVKALVDFGKSAIDLGSDLQEVQNVVDVTFSTMNEAVNEFAKNAAETAGLSETMAKRYTGTFGAMAKAFGFAESEAFDMSTSLTQLAGDVASFYNITQDEAYTKLKSVFTGETESLKDLGVVMTQTALDSYAMAKGFGKTTSQMSEQEKVALRYSFVLDQLSAAQGDFVRTSDSWANQTRILSLNFDSFKANIGQALINIFTPFLKVLNQIVDKMAQLSQRFVAFSEMLVGKSTSGGGGSPGKAVEEIAQGFENVTDATKEAEKAQKKYLSGLDELRTFTKDEANLLSGGSSASIEAVNNQNTNNIGDLSKVTSVLDKTLEELIDLIKNKNWSGLGGFLSDGIVGALDFLNEKLDAFDWEGLGEDVGEFLAGINWIEIIKSAIKLKFNIWKAIAEVWFGAYEAAPIETAVITAVSALKFTGLGGIIGGMFSKAITGTAFATAIIGAFASLGGLGGLLFMNIGVILGAGTLGEIGLLAGTAIIGSLTAAVLGFHIGQWFYEFFTGEDITLSVREQFQAIKDSFTDGTWKDALELLADDLEEGFKGLGDNIAEWWDDIILDIRKALGLVMSDLEQMERFYSGSHISQAGNIHGGGGGRLPRSYNLTIPHLATGAVIPPNAPFAAILGDQKHGTNIEAPLDTIKQAVREVVGNGGGGQFAFSAQINRKVLFEEIIEEAKLRQTTNGRNPFELT